MPEIKGFAYRVEVNLALNRKEISHLMECSKSHGDVKCAGASQQGGFLYGWCNQMDWAEESGEHEIEVRATLRELDTLVKILEIESAMVASKLMKPEDSLYFPIKQILLQGGEESERVNAD
jgi:hypothetical protein